MGYAWDSGLAGNRALEFRAQKTVAVSGAGRTLTSMKTLPARDEMYGALVRRDAAYDGIFVVGVRTTGIFCRPTCTARKPRPQNVEYFAGAREALLAGYRPCKRCHPLDHGGTPPDWVRNLLDRVDRAPTARVTDDDLRSLSIDPIRARRYFKRNYGMTFHCQPSGSAYMPSFL